jgi:hypothetical protein
LLIGAVVCGTVGEVINKAGSPSKLPEHTVLLWGGVALGMWVVATVLLLFAIRSFNKARHAAERQRRTETGARLAADDVTQAHRLAGQLLAGKPSAVGQVWDVVLQPGEQVLVDGTVGYSRYYGFGPAANGAHSGGRPGHAAARAALRDRPVAPAGSRRRVQGSAAAAAAARWRDQQQSRVVVTDRRLLCQLQAKAWVSFDHTDASAIHPAPEKRGVVFEYPGTAPVCLSGPVSTQITVIVVWALHGAEGLREHPALAEVRSVAPLPIATAAAKSSNADASTRPAQALIDATAGRPPGDEGLKTAGPPLEMLTFVAGRELVLAGHAALLLEVSEPEATRRLEGLVERGLVLRVRLDVHTPTAYRITQRGADQIDPAVPSPAPLDLAGYRQALAVRDS